MEQISKIYVDHRPWLADAKAFGLILMGDNSIYELDPEANKDIHIPNIKKDDVLEYFLSPLNETPIKEALQKIVIGHEHGVENNKCHFQIYIEFKKRIHRQIKPFDCKINGTTLLGIYQPMKKRKEALINYCKKDGDFIEWEDKPASFTNDSAYWSSLISQSSNAIDVIESMKINRPKDLLFFGDRIKKNFENLVEVVQPQEFAWVLPQHLMELADKDPESVTHSEFFFQRKCKAIQSWINDYLIPEKMSRRKALFLYSEKRGVGKSQFAKRLVNDPLYYIYNRTSINAEEFERKQKTARLVIIDDVKFVEGDREMWKALISSEETQIVSKYYNLTFKHGLPTIIITNELSTIAFWTDSAMFKTQCIFINIEQYMGPPATQIKELEKIETHFDPDFEAVLDAYKLKKKLNFKANLNN